MVKAPVREVGTRGFESHCGCVHFSPSVTTLDTTDKQCTHRSNILLLPTVVFGARSTVRVSNNDDRTFIKQPYYNKLVS